MKKDFLKKIQNGEIKMKPKWIFDLEKKSIVSAWLISGGIAAVAIVFLLKFVEEYEPLEILKMGEVGQQLLLEDFPYMWLIGGIMLIVVGLVLDSKIGNNYKKSTIWLLISTVAVTILLAILFRFLIA